MQKNTFLKEEGDAWFRRNCKNLESHSLDFNKIMLHLWSRLSHQPQSVLEIGCADGNKIGALFGRYGNAQYFGVDPSPEAIARGMARYPQLNLSQGTADALPFLNGSFDAIIFGFCLYLCDRQDLFKIAYEADRCLKERGFLIIVDFFPISTYKNAYTHKDNLFSYKMNYAKMFLWNPQYSIVEVCSFSHAGPTFSEIEDDRISIQVLFKNPCERTYCLPCSAK